jgi:hypothetical protein
MQTPEILLSKLNQALRELRGAAQVLDNAEFDGQLLPVMRRLLLAEIMNDRWLIAIGGTQSAGKTTLVRSLYDIDANDAWLPPNEGQGETLPILIEERDDQDAPKGYAYVLQPSAEAKHLFDLEMSPLTAKKFVQACRGQMPEVLLPVMRVPRRHFEHDGQALLLLPGYEKRTDQNGAWQDLMRQALVGAAGCIIVSDATRLAGGTQLDLLKDMLANELRTVRPLVVMAKTEAIANDAQKLAELRASAVSAFGLDGPDAEQRVFCAGVKAPGTGDGSVPSWLTALRAAMQDMSLSGTASRQVQLAKLEETLSVDLAAVLAELRTHASLFSRQTGGGSGAEETIKACLDRFDEAAKSLRAGHQNMVAAMTSARFRAAWEDMQDRLESEHEGITNKVKQTFDSATQTQRRLENNVMGAWKKPGPILGEYMAGLGELTAKSVGPLMQQSALHPSPSPLHRLGYLDEKNNVVPSKFTDDAVHANLTALLNSRAGETTVVMTNRELEKTAAMLPVMVLEFTRIASALPVLMQVDATRLTAMPRGDVTASAEAVSQELSAFSEASRGILKGLAAVMAVDVASDGHADILNAVLSSFGIGTAATVGGGTSVLGAAGLSIGSAVVGVIAIGYLTHSALQQVRRHDGEVRSLSKNMLQHACDHHQAHFAARYDELMTTMRSYLHHALRARYGLDGRLMEQDRLQKALADVRVIRQDILSHLASSGHTMALFGNGAA